MLRALSHYSRPVQTFTFTALTRKKTKAVLTACGLVLLALHVTAQQPSDNTSFAEREGQNWRTIALGPQHRDAEPFLEDSALYIDRYRQAVVYDPTIAVFQIKATPVEGTTGTLRLTGDVSLVWHRRGAERMFRALGFNVADNHIRLLPEEAGLGALRFAVATTASATMRRYPAMDAEQVNSIPQGWPMRLLRDSTDEDLATSIPTRHREAAPAPYNGPWMLAQSSDGYVGFVRDDQLSRTTTYRLPDAIISEPFTVEKSAVLPSGAGLARSERDYTTAFGNEWIKVSPPRDTVLPCRAPFTSTTILKAAEPLMKTPYRWGGVTEEGIDCSGFTRLIYTVLGIYLPRDARPQSVVGQIVAFGTDVEREAQAGDLVYFADEAGRISHIGMSLGNGQLIHSSGGAGVHVCDYTETSRSRPNGMLERVVFARRILRSH